MWRLPGTDARASDFTSPASTTLATDSLSRLFERLGGVTPEGLSTAEAERRLADHGPNEPARAHRWAHLGEFLTFLVNPLVLILLLASLVSALLGDVTNASIIAAILSLSVALNFVQSYRSQQAARHLREVVAPTATVRRDGQWREISRRLLVPGDVIRLSAGDRVPADGRLIRTRDLHVQQAALTGESLPMEKEARDLETVPGLLAESPNLVFLGTSVVSGTAEAVVVATGAATAFGEIAARLETRPPETEFERGTRRFALLIMRTVIFLVLFVFLASAALHRPPLQSFLFAIALAVGLTPEFLPMITTITLAKGAVYMARRRVIVKHLAAIEDFGSLDILCSDKTGTLTRGEMTLDQSLDPFGQPTPKALRLAGLNSAHEAGIRSPLDAAILNYRPTGDDIGQKVDEIPFDFERRRVSVVVDTAGQRLLITKGAPESVLAVCTALERDGARRPFDAESQARCRATYETLSAAGARVLAVAIREVLPQTAYRVVDERDLTLVGFLSFTDPLMPDVREAIAALKRDGVTVKILTGDNERVACHICAQVGLDTTEVVLGQDLDRMTDTALAAVAERTHVFARVSPAQKTRVLLALKRNDHVVGFLGDGINDAPSLHAADVGISVANAVDVAKDAADLILLERDLRILHDGIRQGRRAFANVMKYILMGTSSNFGNMFSMAGAVLVLPFLPMLPTQILLNNFLYDLAQVTIPTDRVDDSALAQPQRWNPRVIRDFMLLIGPISSIYDFLTFGVLLRIFNASEALFHTGWFVESLATQTLVLLVIRTQGSPVRSNPSRPLVATTLLIVVIGLGLPFSPIAGPLGFVPLPPAFFAFLIGATVTYLGLVELAKRRLLGRIGPGLSSR
jgi:P-type Mg2+ transporter